MKHLIILLIFVLLFCNHILGASFRTLEKRQICSNRGCNVCDGSNCNTCYNNDCCSSVNCNKCVNECSSQCNTISCQQNCVSGCSNTCQADSCAVSSCSQCVNKCSNQCSSNQCTKDCSNRCDCNEQPQPIFVEDSKPSNIIVNNTNNNIVNLTTHININNVVHNFNNITVPVYVNATSINNINLSGHDEYRPPPGPPIIIITPPPSILPTPPPIDNCCYVLHPRRCYTDDSGSDRCYIRRHKECSNSCTSPVISIEEDERSHVNQCQYIHNYPYAYCGNYVIKDCSQCHTCGGSYNPSECSKRVECSDTCKRSVSNCVPSHSGLQCN